MKPLPQLPHEVALAVMPTEAFSDTRVIILVLASKIGSIGKFTFRSDLDGDKYDVNSGRGTYNDVGQGQHQFILGNGIMVLLSDLATMSAKKSTGSGKVYRLKVKKWNKTTTKTDFWYHCKWQVAESDKKKITDSDL